MSIIFLLIPLAVVLAGAAVGAFVWSARNGQMDDLQTPALRLLLDEATRKTVPSPGLERDPALPSGSRKKKHRKNPAVE